jgi:endogenous inhibitor of DNA gyrase (YacG/DUF329 family)
MTRPPGHRYYCRRCHIGYDTPSAGRQCPTCGKPVERDIRSLGAAVAARPRRSATGSGAIDSVVHLQPERVGLVVVAWPERECANCGLLIQPVARRDLGACCPLCAVRLEGRKARRRARELEHGRFFVSVDASWAEGVAGLAFDSEQIGAAQRTVGCASSTIAELMALLFAMAASDGHDKVTFRVDCAAAANPHKQSAQQRVTAEELRPLRRQAVRLLSGNPGWRLVRIPRTRNVRANWLARRAREYPGQALM